MLVVSSFGYKLINPYVFVKSSTRHKSNKRSVHAHMAQPRPSVAILILSGLCNREFLEGKIVRYIFARSWLRGNGAMGQQGNFAVNRLCLTLP